MDFENRPAGPFFTKRNLIALFVWILMLILLVVGITVNAVRYSHDTLTQTEVFHRLRFALLCFVIMSLVFVAQWLFRFRLPIFVELSLVLFSFLALGGGTVFGIYAAFPGYDKLLHVIAGCVFGCVGICIADLFLKDQPLGTRKAMSFLVVGFLFVLAVNCLWEIFEYTVDSIIPGYNNQKWLQGILEEYENGTYLTSNNRGTGLHDTMWDMIAATLGSLAVFLPLLVAFIKKPERIQIFHVQVKHKPRKSIYDTPVKKEPEKEEYVEEKRDDGLQTNQTEDI